MPRKQGPAQKLAELICRRYFGKDGIDLPTKFWHDIRYAKHYKLQIIKANALLKIYKFEAILAALNSKEGKNIWSLTASWLEPIIAVKEQEMKILERKKQEFKDTYQKIETPATTSETPLTISPLKQKPSLLDKLDEG